VKKYTEDHEWIELDSDGKTGMHSSAIFFITCSVVRYAYTLAQEP